MISHPELEPRDRQVDTSKSALRDKHQLSRSALIPLDKFALSNSFRMHKSSEFVSPIGSSNDQVEQAFAPEKCGRQLFVELTCLDLPDNPARDFATNANARKSLNARYPKSMGVHFGMDREIMDSRSRSQILRDRCAGSGMGWHRPRLLGLPGAGGGRKGCHDVSGPLTQGRTTSCASAPGAARRRRIVCSRPIFRDPATSTSRVRWAWRIQGSSRGCSPSVTSLTARW